MTAASIAAAPQAPAGLPLAEHARPLPSPLLLSSGRHGWREVTVQRFRLPSGVTVAPPSGDHRLELHLSGRTLADVTCNGRRERRWSDGGYSNVIPAGMPMTMSMKGPADAVRVYVAPALVDRVVEEAFDLDPAHVRLTERLFLYDETLNQLCRLILAEAEAEAPGGRLLAEMLARALAVHLVRRSSTHACKAPEDAPTVASPGAMAGRRLRRVLEHMDAHLAEDLPLDRLAAVGGVGASQFARTFRAAMGEPPHRYLVLRRVERARELLERTRLPVIEVGLRCGFEQPSHFATVFRQHAGLSPRAYRTARCA